MANPEHLEILKQGVEAWNKWREENPGVEPDLSSVAIYEVNSQIQFVKIDSEEIREKIKEKLSSVEYKGVDLREYNFGYVNLERANLLKANLQGTNLIGANLQGTRLQDTNLQGAELSCANLQEAELGGADLQRAMLLNANLQRAELSDANLQEADFFDANLHGAYLVGTNLRRASLLEANLQEAKIFNSNLQEAELVDANLKKAVFKFANCQGTKLSNANFQGADLSWSKLQNADFGYAIVDGETLVRNVEVNRDTNFKGVGLDAMRIDPGIKQLLEYNIRRKNWKRWYAGKSENKFMVWVRKCFTFPIRGFWWMSDYGRSTGRIILTFFGLALFFALIYRVWPQSIIVNGEVGHIRSFLHSLYFSVVTMTTLGFGDIAANPDSNFGQILLMVEVILGYVLLGALVTRFAVLFTAGGPAAKFTELSEEN
jgi:uncharacterized protein YjbI with pentapeptide repeats